MGWSRLGIAFHIASDMIRFMQYRLLRHRAATEGGCISDWYRKDIVSASARAEFDKTLRDLRILAAKDWSRPDYSALSGKHSGIGEIRFKGDKREYRPLGFFLTGDAQETFVILIGAHKKMGKWTPLEARDSAIERRKDVLRDRTYIGDYAF